MGTGGECEEGVGDEVGECRAGLILAAWAVGGEVSQRFDYTSYVVL